MLQALNQIVWNKMFLSIFWSTLYNTIDTPTKFTVSPNKQYM